MIRASRVPGALVISLALTLSLVAPARAQFEIRGRFIAASNPTSIAVGDFNHDGKRDLAATAPGGVSGSVVILLGNGDGTFRTGASYSAGVGPFSIVAADFNNDGILDLAVANDLSPYLTILLGNGDGTFRYGPQSPQTPSFENYVTVGDFNGDHIPDILALSISNPCMCISVLIGNGDGTFQDAINAQPAFTMLAATVGDFNGDGKVDVATAGIFGGSSSVNILLGNGDGTFQIGASYPGESTPVAMAVADFNRDRKMDLAIAYLEGTGISVMLGNGDGTFQKAVDYPTAFPDGVAVGDFNGDQVPDLVAANLSSPSGVSVFLGNGDGTFQPGVMYPSGVEYGEDAYVALGDFNRDDKMDIVTADYRYNDVVVLLNTGVVSFFPTTALNFQKQAVGTTSQPQTVSLTNTGKTALRLASMKASAEFGVASTCGSSVPAGAKCTISATFSPTKKGAVQGTISIVDSASTKPQVIELLGTGT